MLSTLRRYPQRRRLSWVGHRLPSFIRRRVLHLKSPGWRVRSTTTGTGDYSDDINWKGEFSASEEPREPFIIPFLLEQQL